MMKPFNSLLFFTWKDIHPQNLPSDIQDPFYSIREEKDFLMYVYILVCFKKKKDNAKMVNKRFNKIELFVGLINWFGFIKIDEISKYIWLFFFIKSKIVYMSLNRPTSKQHLMLAVFMHPKANKRWLWVHIDYNLILITVIHDFSVWSQTLKYAKFNQIWYELNRLKINT